MYTDTIFLQEKKILKTNPLYFFQMKFFGETNIMMVTVIFFQFPGI